MEAFIESKLSLHVENGNEFISPCFYEIGKLKTILGKRCDLQLEIVSAAAFMLFYIC